MRRTTLVSILLAATALSGCDLFGESAEKLAAAREAEGKAIGSACRHAGRAIEDCYALNRKADKAAMFAGWRDMNDYMRENKIEVVAPQKVSARPEPKVIAESPAADPKPAADAVEEGAAPLTEKRPAKAGAGKAREAKAPDS